MKVLFLASWWPSRIYPTHGNFVYKHARTVAKRHRIVVVAVQEDKDLSSGTVEVVKQECDNFSEVIVYYATSRASGRMFTTLNRLKCYYLGSKKAFALLGSKPDLIHAHVTVDAGITAYFMSVMLNLPFLISEHSTRYLQRSSISSLRRLLVRLACRNAFAVAPVSQYLAECMQRLHGIPGCFKVISNVVDDTLFCIQPPKKINAKFKLLHVSTLKDDQKNVTGILHAFARIEKRFPGSFHLHIVGEGDSRPFAKYSKKIGINGEAITFTGTCPEERIASLMQASDAFILFSNYETQGVVVLEALCCGLPCIVSDIRPLNDLIVPEKDGILVPPRDYESLADAIVSMRDSFESFNTLDISYRARNRYGESVIGDALDALYQRAT